MAADKHEVIFCTDAGKRMDRTAFDSAQIDNDTARFEICNIFFDKINCLLRIERDKYNIGICKNRSIPCASAASVAAGSISQPQTTQSVYVLTARAIDPPIRPSPAIPTLAMPLRCIFSIWIPPGQTAVKSRRPCRLVMPLKQEWSIPAANDKNRYLIL